MKDRPKYNYLDKEQNRKTLELNALNRLQAMFKYHGLPESIPQRELEKILLGGFACIAEVEGVLYAFGGGLGGVPDVYYRPTICTVANPALNLSRDFKIGVDCMIVKADSYMQGVLPLVERYAFLLNENLISLVLATVNSRLQMILSAGDDNTRTSASEFLSQVFAGKQGVIADNAFLKSLDVHSVSTTQDNSIPNLITENQYIKACFLNDIGLTANTQLKKERLISSEIENNSASLYPIVDDMLACRREGLEKVNAMFGTSIEVEFSSSWDYRIFQGASIHNTQEEVSTDELQEEEQDATADDGAEEEQDATADDGAEEEQDATADDGAEEETEVIEDEKTSSESAD